MSWRGTGKTFSGCVIRNVLNGEFKAIIVSHGTGSFVWFFHYTKPSFTAIVGRLISIPITSSLHLLIDNEREQQQQLVHWTTECYNRSPEWANQ